MSKLYPIGTQLITRRLSQAALAHELGFLIETQASNGGFYPSFDFGFDASGLFHFDTWRVIATKENQKWLSPVPMLGDKIHVFYSNEQEDEKEGAFFAFRYGKISFPIGKGTLGDITHWTCRRDDGSPDHWNEFLGDYPGYKIIQRTYPNGQRAPMLEWDEVIEPESEGRQ